MNTHKLTGWLIWEGCIGKEGRDGEITVGEIGGVHREERSERVDRKTDKRWG